MSPLGLPYHYAAIISGNRWERIAAVFVMVSKGDIEAIQTTHSIPKAKVSHFEVIAKETNELMTIQLRQKCNPRHHRHQRSEQ